MYESSGKASNSDKTTVKDRQSLGPEICGKTRGKRGENVRKTRKIMHINKYEVDDKVNDNDDNDAEDDDDDKKKRKKKKKKEKKKTKNK